MNDNDYFFVDRSAEHKARRERLAQKKVESWKRNRYLGKFNGQGVGRSRQTNAP